MRNYTIGFFHKTIIASLCCMILLSGCGYKANPYWKDKPSQQEEKS